MKRRSFLTLLGLAPVAPVVAKEMIAESPEPKVEPAPVSEEYPIGHMMMLPKPDFVPDDKWRVRGRSVNGDYIVLMKVS